MNQHQIYSNIGIIFHSILNKSFNYHYDAFSPHLHYHFLSTNIFSKNFFDKINSAFRSQKQKKKVAWCGQCVYGSTGAIQGPYLRCIWLPDRFVLVRARRGWSWVIITELFSVSSALGSRWDERPLHKTLPWCSFVSGSVLACPRLPAFHGDLTNL